MTAPAATRIRRTLKSGALIGCVLLLGACASSTIAPVGREPDRNAARRPAPAPTVAGKPSRAVPDLAGDHRVAGGETLYSIAWRHGLDYKELAAWNRIAAPFTIYPGQRLRLSGPALVSAEPRAEAPEPFPPPPATPSATGKPPQPKVAPPAARPAPKSRMKAAARPPAKAVTQASKRTSSSSAVSAKGWSWPTQGKVITTFKGGGGKGVDFAGKEGQAIEAAAAGDVVYSGSGLRGYGQLIIIKHNKNFLSAYAHNKKLHVAEGDKVVRGQRIADMGRTGAERVKLHFEIRKNGKPVDPFGYLPRKPGRR